MMEIDSKSARFLARMGARGVLGQAVLDMAEEGKDFFAVSADFNRMSGYDRFKKLFPDRHINTGIAEQNMIGVSAGLAAFGTPVIATSHAMFVTVRCADQIRNFMGYMRRSIKLVGINSGLNLASFGCSHCNPQNIAFLRTVPGISILSPCDGSEIYRCIWAAMETDGPVYIRLTGDTNLPVIYKAGLADYRIGKAIRLLEGPDVALIGCGVILAEVLKAADLLAEKGVRCTVIDMHTIKPLDTDMLDTLWRFPLIVTIEEHSAIGGLGSAMADYVVREEGRPPVMLMGAADMLPKADSYEHMLSQCG